MNYNVKATAIINESIKSAVFIDENARAFFTEEKDLNGEIEEQLSVELYSNFKENGISLAIHKYKPDDETNEKLKTYLFEDRDLVLLDWNLEGSAGQDKSLKLLSEIVHKPHIHFCTIYTSEKGSDLESVFSNILSYFSGEDETYFNELKEDLELEADIVNLKAQIDNININRHSKNVGKELGALVRAGHKSVIEKIVELTKENDRICALSKASIALNNNHKSPTVLPCPSTSSLEEKSLVINNTIITILNKGENSPEDLIANLSKQIVKSKTSFTQLLGLEMQSIFSRSSSFIDDSLIQSSKDAVLYHRNHYKSEDMEHLFPEFIKDIMLEKAKLNLRGESLSLLESEFLNSEEYKSPKDDELVSMNVFYNSSRHNGTKKVNFGDVFKVKDKPEYYICITALCDCLRPDKIENRFFFAKGEPIKKEDALLLGDTAFVSFIDSNNIVKWTEVNTQIKNDTLHKHSPVYVKPLQFTVVKTEFDSNTDLIFNRLNSEGKIEELTVVYLSTIKSNYTQRIANHAFSHPVRVGVDFVKKKN